MSTVTRTSVQRKTIGGLPVQFKPVEKTVVIAGDALTYGEWQALEKTINRMFERTGDYKPPSAAIQIFDIAPWWLRLLGIGGTISRRQVPTGHMR